MATFSVNQVRHLYVLDDQHTAELKSDVYGNMYFKYLKDDVPAMRTDLIDPKNVLYATMTSAAQMERVLKTATVKLAAGTSLVVGQDYILRININQYLGMSDEDVEHRYGMVRVRPGMQEEDFYAEMAKSLNSSFIKEPAKLFTFEATEDSVIIKEVEQEWRRGLVSSVPVYFEVFPSEIVMDGMEVVWGEVEYDADGYVSNGKTIADLEYFLMGERADQYRGISWPHNIETEYLVDPSKEYTLLDIHFCYIGSGENPQRSEKTITFASANNATIEEIKTQLEAKGVTVNMGEPVSE